MSLNFCMFPILLQTRLFDEEAKDSRSASLHVASISGSGFGESYSLSNPSIRAEEDIPQPTIFNGKLKGYQLKGMNWLANLYEQVSNRSSALPSALGNVSSPGCLRIPFSCSSVVC